MRSLTLESSWSLMSTVQPPLVILASTLNETGDLFTELLASFLSTVGYEQCRFNVHKSGREIDVEGTPSA
jgi:hypothetical protein